ncbi:YolD-like family protein [Neobacillus sp. D3-1R]|uniref:YolD-like family protein n=1 Tax=Neobacillus sp. D3-1R TaxID=3445778 RepID=UPI003FA17D05
MIRDRGRIKWTAMMLPEHVKLLRDWANEDTFEHQKELDDQKLEEMNSILATAMEEHQSVIITHYQNHSQKYQLVMGRIHYWDEFTQKLHIVDHFQEIHRISILDIADVQLKE